MKFYEGPAPDWDLVPKEGEELNETQGRSATPFKLELVQKITEQKQESPEIVKEDIFQNILEEAKNIELNDWENRNSKGQLLAPDGSVSHLQNELYWKIARTPSFREWFGKSIVCHENGEPKLVYRGTLKKHIDISDGVKFKSNAQEWKIGEEINNEHVGVFFTPHRDKVMGWFKTEWYDEAIGDYREDQKEFLKEKSEFLKEHEEQIKTTTAFIKLENPYIESGTSSRPPQAIDFVLRARKGGEDFLNNLIKNNDGLYVPGSGDFGDEYAVIKNENIFILPSAVMSKKSL